MNHIKLGLTIKKIIFIFVLMFLASCIYEPFGLYENPVNTNPIAPQITNLELNVNADTLWVYGNQKLKYHFKSSVEKQSILGLKIYIDGVLCDSVLSDNGEFNILQSALIQGKHKMKIFFYTNSGTGSIAERLNAEVMLLTKEWVVMADYSTKNVGYTIENGYLKLHWDAYKNLDIKSYNIQYLGNIKDNNYIDQSYYGAKMTYKITVEKTNGDIISWANLDMEQNIPQPELKISNNDTYTIIWHKSPFYNAVKYRYEFHNQDDSSCPEYGDYGYKNISDTVYSCKMHFSDRFYFILYALPNNISENTSNFMSYQNSYISQYAGELVNIRKNTSYTSADTLTSFDDKNVYKYFLNGQTVYNEPILPINTTRFVPMQLSPRGKYLLGIIYPTNTTGYKYFAKDLTTGEVYYINYIEPGSSALNYYLSMRISDNGIGIFELATKEILFDFKTNTEIASRPLSTPQSELFNFKISPDGKHVMSSIHSQNTIVNVFNLNASDIEKIYTIESTYSKWQFSPVDPNMITSVKNKTLSVIQCEPYALLRKIQFADDEVFMNIDYFNNEILTINANQFIIRDFISGEVKKRFAKRNQLYYEYENFLLHNHYLISNGVKLKIQ